jgi:membrane protease YdiL (CAAX protease family)
MLAAVWLSSILGTKVLVPEYLNRLYQLVPTFLIALVINGPFSEELGWRGFVLPRLELRAVLFLPP